MRSIYRYLFPNKYRRIERIIPIFTIISIYLRLIAFVIINAEFTFKTIHFVKILLTSVATLL